ncbi:MAG TPA: helix-turn-helix domain-containing protein [Candidatus Acidoferrum sp.]|nr:helix-turn-helix domain-containing protein [Candidatus Acidoferrum sp.]
MAKLRVVPATPIDALAGLDPTRLSEQDLGILALCSELAREATASERHPVGLAQRALHAGEAVKAIRILRLFLTEHELDYRRKSYKVNAERIAHFREIRGLTQAQLAKMLGKTTGQISHVERGRNGLSAASFLLVLSALEVTAANLLLPAPLLARK